MTAADLIEFYTTIDEYMPDYDAKRTTTEDVVRSVIIPETKSWECSYAEAYGKIAFPSKIVTHTWKNLFTDLVAAVVADALEEDTYDHIAQTLVTRQGRDQLLQE